MSQQLVECVPNFSDGRRPEVYNAIAEAIAAVPGVQMLGVSPDPDHNRTVVTFVGPPEAVEEAAFRGIARAAELIDLDQHEGEHPRIGATDVCPFIPVRGVRLSDCVAIARRLGERVGDELEIAVYLYARAATRPDRESLPKIRKGEYELWKEEVATHPDRQPDFGPAEPKPWGATVIGARPFLIAYNLYLNTDDVEMTDKIARSVRYLSGGFRYVQGKGFLVEGQGQVSMNLTNFKRTPVYRVQEAVRREAARYGLAITRAELVGLIPQKALMDAAKWYLQLDELSDDQILEYRLAKDAERAGLIPDAFLEAVASKQPTPGGGSVAALAGALGAALAGMVAGLTAGRKKYAGVATQAVEILERSKVLQAELAAAITEDARAFDQVMAAYGDKRLDEVEKAAAIEAATVGAGEVPLRVARLSREVARLALEIARVGNVNAVTDAAAAGLMARAAVQAAGLNVRVNAVGLRDRDLAQIWGDEVAALNAEAAKLANQVMQVAAERGGF